MGIASGTRVRHYLVEEEIGVGGMSSVWSARDERTGAWMALKVLNVSEAPDTARLRLLREARAMRAIKHPAIVPVSDVFEHDATPVLVMELLRGETLRALLMREQSVSIARAAELLVPIAEALTEAHAAGFVHRDLKPENIFVEQIRDDGRENVRLLDFGVTRSFAEPPGSEETPITALGSLVGTIAYMAPEQALHPSQPDPRVDVWSFGVTLYELLSGCRPIEGDTKPELMRQLLVGGITPLAVLRPDLPPDIVDLVMGMLNRNPERRPASLEPALRLLRSKLTFQ